MPWAADFQIQHENPQSVTVIDHSNGSDTANSVNSAFAKLVSECIDRNLFHVLDGKHSEPFAILGANYPVYIERFASSLFGITSCGAHLVAYVGKGDDMKIWIGRRASHLYTSPGKLDTTVGGGVKAGVSPLETVVNEADEEASLPADLIRETICPRGVITNVTVTRQDFPGEKGLVVPDLNYVYDVQLLDGVTPEPNDDEVDGFNCMTVDEVKAALLRKEFKPESAAVLIDFFIRHGIISAENEPNYVEIISHLHRRLPFRIAPNREK